MAAELPIRIVYEDQSLIVVDKPAGLPTVSPRSVGKPSAWSALRRILQAREERPRSRGRRAQSVELYLIHRLDQPASGLLVFARTERARAGLKELLATREMSRRYAAIVEGRPRQEQGEIRSSLVELEGPTHPVRSLRASDGAERRAKARMAVTRYRLLATHEGRSALEVELQTGRKHQIRVHLAEAGHPVAGDRLYGPRGGAPRARAHAETPLAGGMSSPRRGSGKAGSGGRPGRLLLHAWKLAFQHPITRRKLEFVSPPGPEFEEAVPGAFAAP